MYLEYSTHFMLFFSPHVAFALEAFVHLYAAAKKTLFSIQSNKKSVNRGTLPVFNFYHQTPCEICPIYLSGNMKEFIWKKSGKVKNLYGKCEGLLKKHRQLYGKMPNLTEKAEEFIWQKFGKVQNLFGIVKDLYKEQ